MMDTEQVNFDGGGAGAAGAGVAAGAKPLKGAGRWARRAAKALVGQDGTGG